MKFTSRVVTLVAAIAVGLSGLNQAQATLIAYWSFDDDTFVGGQYLDGSSAERHATVVSTGSASIESAPGVFGGQAASWVGVSTSGTQSVREANAAYMTFDNLFEIMGSTGGDYSFSLWVNFSTSQTSPNWEPFLASWPAGSGNSYWLTSENSNRVPRHTSRYGPGGPDNLANRTLPDNDAAHSLLNTGANADADGWVHVAWTWEKAARTLRTYINGEEVDEFTPPSTPTDDMFVSLSPIGWIGRKDDTGHHFTGMMDEVWIYSRLLSEAEISNLHQFNVVPEPATWALLATGLIGAVPLVRRARLRRRAASN